MEHEQANCPAEIAISLLGSKWKLLILRESDILAILDE